MLLLGDKQKFVSCFLTLAVEVAEMTIEYLLNQISQSQRVFAFLKLG